MSITNEERRAAALAYADALEKRAKEVKAELYAEAKAEFLHDRATNGTKSRDVFVGGEVVGNWRISKHAPTLEVTDDKALYMYLDAWDMLEIKPKKGWEKLFNIQRDEKGYYVEAPGRGGTFFTPEFVAVVPGEERASYYPVKPDELYSVFNRVFGNGDPVFLLTGEVE